MISRRLTASEVAAYDSEGYLLLEGLIGADVVDQLVEATQSFVERSRSLKDSVPDILLGPGHSAQRPMLRRIPQTVAFHPLFVSAAALTLYSVFLFVQTVRHRDFFLPPVDAEDEDVHALPPTLRVTLLSGVFLVLALTAVVLLAKALSYPIEKAVRDVGIAQPAALIGAIVASLVLLPEGAAALHAARRNRLQTSLNLALGSGLASISLTIPAVAAVSVWLGQPLILGLGPKEIVILSLTLVVSALTLGSGRTTVLHGAVHLVIFAVFVYLLIVP